MSTYPRYIQITTPEEVVGRVHPIDETALRDIFTPKMIESLDRGETVELVSGQRTLKCTDLQAFFLSRQ